MREADGGGGNIIPGLFSSYLHFLWGYVDVKDRWNKKLLGRLYFTVYSWCLYGWFRYLKAILANITGSISLQWLAMFPISSEPPFLDIFMNSQFSERWFLTIPQVALPAVDCSILNKCLSFITFDGRFRHLHATTT